MPLNKKQRKFVKKKIDKTGDFHVIDGKDYFYADDDTIYELDFDNNQNLKKNEIKIKEDKNMPNENEKDMTEDQEEKGGDNIENNKKIATEVDDCMKKGKTREECQDMIARQNKGGKHEPYIGKTDESLALPEFTDTGSITPDMVKTLVEQNQTLIKKLESIETDFKPYKEQIVAKEAKDFTDAKNILITDYEVCKDFVETLDFKEAKKVIDAFERSELIKEARFYRDPMTAEPPSVLDMEDKQKNNDENWSYLKVS